MKQSNNLSRTQNATSNIMVSVFTQIITTVLSFANRSIFIKILGDGYLGIDGLFTSILTVMSLAELGIGNAIVFSLYKPVAENDYPKIRQLMALYAKTYRIIAVCVATVGVALMPFLDKIVNFQSVSVDVNLHVIYILFLLNTCSSYFWAYKQAMIMVSQRQRVISTIQMMVKLVVVVLEILVLALTHNYYAYLIIRVVLNYVQAFVIGRIADTDYPDAKFGKTDKLPSAERKSIFANVRALVWYKVSNVFITSTDNIMINAFVGTEMVGIFSNYTLITTAVQNVTSQIFTALTATIGNFNAMEKKENQEKLFDRCVFITYIVYGLCSVCLFVLSNRFVSLMWGKAYLLDISIVAIVVLNFYLYGFQSSILIFRNTNGLFVQGKYRPAVSALINVVASYLLAMKFGVIGVVLGTVISRVTTTTWFDPYILYKYQFPGRVARYYFRFSVYTIFTGGIAAVALWITNFVPQTFFGFIVSAMLCVVLFAVVTVLCFIKTDEFSFLWTKFGNILKRQ